MSALSNIAKATREPKPSLQLLDDLHSKLGTWKAVAKAVGVTDRSLRRYRDGTRNPDARTAPKIKEAAQRKKIAVTELKPVQPGDQDRSRTRRMQAKARATGQQIQVTINYRITYEESGKDGKPKEKTEDRFESFIWFNDEDDLALDDQLHEYIQMIKRSKNQSRRQAKIISVDLKFVK